MKKTFKVSIKIKKCDIEFKENMGKGIIGYTDITYDLDEKEYEKPIFIVGLINEGEVLLKELIDIKIEEIKE